MFILFQTYILGVDMLTVYFCSSVLRPLLDLTIVFVPVYFL